jgi:hypothetical protein
MYFTEAELGLSNRRRVARRHQPKEIAMKEIEAYSTVQSDDEPAGASKSRKSQSLRLDKQTIRTLTGAELRLAGGGCIYTKAPYTWL